MAGRTTGDKFAKGEVAGEAVHLKMEGGYGQEFLVPGEAEPGQPGVILVQKGDTITAGAVSRMERARKNAARLKRRR